MQRCLTLILIIACLAAPAGAATTVAAPPAQDFILGYSNNVQGETEPCG